VARDLNKIQMSQMFKSFASDGFWANLIPKNKPNISLHIPGALGSSRAKKAEPSTLGLETHFLRNQAIVIVILNFYWDFISFRCESTEKYIF
jgi:hypothetical protein